MKKIKTVILILLIIFLFLSLLLIRAAGPAHQPDSTFVKGVTSFSKDKTEADFSGKLRVVTYNIGYASGMLNNQGVVYDRDFILKNLDAAAMVLHEKNADVIAFQEIDFDSQRTFGINQLEYLAKKLDLPFGAYALNWSKKYIPYPYWPPKIHFGRTQSGLAILSRYPILSNDITILEKPGNNPFWYNWFYIDRNVQHVELQAGDYSIHVYNLHLEAFDHETRLGQVHQVAKFFNNKPKHRTIVMGDFNDPQKETLDKKIRDTTTEFGEQTGLTPVFPVGQLKTYPSNGPAEQLDHIFISKHFQVQNMAVLQIDASDHLPVWVEFEVH